MPVLHAPLSPDDARTLRRAVLDLATTDRRRRIPPVLHVGAPGESAVAVVDDPAWDHGLRTEIVGAALRRTGGPWVWLTRSGPLVLQDADASWLGAVLSAAAERDADASYVVVTRHGWLDPRSGLSREWRRIRDR